jgi:hypothetical protein
MGKELLSCDCTSPLPKCTAAEFLSKGSRPPFLRVASSKMSRGKRLPMHLPFVFNIEGTSKDFYRWGSADHTKLLKMKPTEIPPMENNEYLPPPHSTHSLYYSCA